MMPHNTVPLNRSHVVSDLNFWAHMWLLLHFLSDTYHFKKESINFLMNFFFMSTDYTVSVTP